MSRKEFAASANIAPRTLQNVEKGAIVRLVTARKVAGALEVKPQELGHPVFSWA